MSKKKEIEIERTEASEVEAAAAEIEVKEEKAKTQNLKEPEVTFSVESILNSKQFNNIQRDLLGVKLNSNRNYTLNQVSEILKNELSRKVN